MLESEAASLLGAAFDESLFKDVLQNGLSNKKRGNAGRRYIYIVPR